MNDTSLFVYSDELLTYKFNDEHPFNQKRLKLTLDLLKKHHAINDDQIIKPRMATDAELELIHDHHYVNAVRLAGQGKLPLKRQKIMDWEQRIPLSSPICMKQAPCL